MFSTRTMRQAIIAVVAVGTMISAVPAAARTIGQVIDDSRITTEVKSKLVADKISNLTHITVKTEDGTVYLSGDVDRPERRDRATQIALDVKGVKHVVNNVRVRVKGTSGSSAPAAPPPSAPATPATMPSPASPQGRTVDFRETIAPRASWRMGTVSRVDAARNLIILTDGTTIRVSPSTAFQVRGRRLTLAELEPGSEIVIRTPLTSASGPAGRTSTMEPSQIAGVASREDLPYPTIDASEVRAVWAPSMR